MDLNKLLVNSKKILNPDENTDSNEELYEGKVVQLVSFMLDDVEYGVDILSVHEILRFPELTRLPNTPPFIKGVINLRGNVIPVVDMRIRFGFKEGAVTDLTRIIVVETDGKQVGILVDNVYQVVRIPVSSIDPPSDLITGISEDFISGIGRLRDRLIVLLNMTQIIFLEDNEEEKSFISSNN
ncbi:MAG: chemotaxis protein CheW [Spirochaetota bacterium]